ncbi:protein bric-a-brac 2 [Caerostris extrusa]|uniref:Protein bric-a-brac 2 n=1 Tax=Caerostris extrusa TaxID=172846 RepID=A0AAV4MUC5_CAEEX|nr:protein bric-a-brac 2 [Caerostris extrusa]
MENISVRRNSLSFQQKPPFTIVLVRIWQGHKDCISPISFVLLVIFICATMAQQFCLKWNNHMNNMMDVFKSLLSSESMVDVTLACDGLSLKAHKIVLSACSPFFQSLFLENPCKHPIVIMKDMKYPELKAIIEFMYHGEVNVAQDQLSALMKTAETLRVKGLAEMPNEKDSSSKEESSTHRSGSRDGTPPPSKRRRGRVRKRSLSDSNRSDDSQDAKIKPPPSPEIEELSGDMAMDGSSGQFSNLQSQVPMQSLPSHSTNSYQKSSSIPSQDPQIEEPASADESEFGVEPAKLLEQSLTTDDLNARRSSRNTMSSGMELQRRPRSSTADHSSTLVPTSISSDISLGSNQQPESPPDIKPEIIDMEQAMSPVAGPSHSTDNSMMMYMDQSSMSSHPGTSYQDNSALVPQDSQPQEIFS